MISFIVFKLALVLVLSSLFAFGAAQRKALFLQRRGTWSSLHTLIVTQSRQSSEPSSGFCCNTASENDDKDGDDEETYGCIHALYTDDTTLYTDVS
jgi:hypothetical protein